MSCNEKKEKVEVQCAPCDSDDYKPGVLSHTGTAWLKTVREVLMAPPLKCCDCIPPAQPCSEDDDDDEFNACMYRLKERRRKK